MCEKDTANNDGLILNVAINYGGRMELVNAVRDISQKVAEGRMEADSVTEETITNHLYPSASSDVDLLIRTGGESRISNFLYGRFRIANCISHLFYGLIFQVKSWKRLFSGSQEEIVVLAV